MNDGKNITKNDMRFFQNELLTDLKKLELQTSSKITNLSQTLIAKTTDYDLKISRITDNISELISQFASRKFDSERIEELLNMKTVFNDQIIENKNRTSIISKALEDSIYKYDKIILENLQLPGIIGVGCKFKNCRMFFENVNNELKLTQKFKEEQKSAFKSFHEKIDMKVFKIENELTKLYQNINQICQTKIEKFCAKLEQRLELTDNMVNATRIENSKYTQELIEASTSLKIQWERLENIKNEIYQKFYEELDIFKKLVDSANRKYYEHNGEFKLLKQRFTQLADYIKDFRNQKNKDYKELLKNINFNKNQKLNEDYDMSNYDKIGNDVLGYIKSSSPNKKEVETKIPPKKRESFSSGTSSRNYYISPVKTRRKSMFPQNQQNNLGAATIKKDNKVSQKNVVNYNNFNIKNKEVKEVKEVKDNIMKVQAMTIKKDIKRKKLLNDLRIKTEKKREIGRNSFIKVMSNKTIVTENDIDLNFGSKRDNDKIKEKDISELSDEEDDILSESESSHFSLLSEDKSSKSNSMNKEKKDNKKNENDIKKVNDKEKINNIEKYNNKERLSIKGKIDIKENINKISIKEIIYDKMKENKNNKLSSKDIIYDKMKENKNNKISSKEITSDKMKENKNNKINNKEITSDKMKENKNNKISSKDITSDKMKENTNNKINSKDVAYNKIKENTFNKISSKDSINDKMKNNSERNEKQKENIKKENEKDKYKTDKKEKINNKDKDKNLIKEIIETREKVVLKEILSSRDKKPNKEKIIESNENKIINLKDNLKGNKLFKTVSDFPKINNNIITNINKNNDIQNKRNFNENNCINSKTEINLDNKIKKLQISETPKQEKENKFKKNIQNAIIENKNKKLEKNKSNENSKIIDKNKSEKEEEEISKYLTSKENKEEINNIKEKKDINQNEIMKKGSKKCQSISFLEQKKKIDINIPNKNDKNDMNIKLRTEVTFPKIKTLSNDLNIKDSIKLTENTQQTNNQNMESNPDDISRNKSEHFKRNQLNFNNIMHKIKKSNSIEEKQLNNIMTNSEKINKLDENNIKSNNIFTIINNVKKEFKKMNTSNTNDNSSNAFLTSLNNINNNYNYYYNNNLNDNKNIITILDDKNIKNEEKMEKINNKIDFINGNIKSVNQRINILEDRYKTILNQLNNIYNIVSSHRHRRRFKNSTKKEKPKREKEKEDPNENQKFMNRLYELYNDDEYNFNINNNEFNKTLKKIEPFLIKKFQKKQ